MEFNENELKNLIKEVMETCLDNTVKVVKTELSGNAQAMMILNNELSHIKNQVSENTKNLNSTMIEVRDVKNICIGVDGANGLRSRIEKVEAKNCQQDDQDNCIKKEVDVLKNFKQQLIGLSIGASITASTLGSIIAYLISKGALN